MKKIIALLIGIVLIVAVFNYKNIIYTDYQQDYLYVCDKVLETYPFKNQEEEETFKKARDTYLKEVKNVESEETFIGCINLVLDKINSPHTVLKNAEESYYLYMIYKNTVEQYPEDDYVYGYIVDEFEKNRDMPKYESFEQNNMSEPYPDNFNYFPLVEGEIGYMGIKSFLTYNVENDKEIVRKCLNEFKDYDSIIIDLRNNSGGNSAYFSDMFLPMVIKEDLELEYYSLIREITVANEVKYNKDKIQDNEELVELIEKRFEKDSSYVLDKYKYYRTGMVDVKKSDDSIEYQGKIYLLINDGTGSSAGYFATFVKGSKIGTLVGSNTSEETIGTDPAMYVLPNSKLILRLEDELVLSEALDFKRDGKITNGSISPDIQCDYVLRDWVTEDNWEKDLCIKLVLEEEQQNQS